MQCPKCQTENPDGSTFCRECGSKFQHSCQQCGKAILPDDKFCNTCGHNLQATITTKPEDRTKEKPTPLSPSDSARKFSSDIHQRAFMKLNAIDAAVEIKDLRLPPSNRLEALKGNRKGQWSIRINDQWRICFKWVDDHAEDVEIVDYHR
jgi:proteic killer suppression protein